MEKEADESIQAGHPGKNGSGYSPGLMEIAATCVFGVTFGEDDVNDFAFISQAGQYIACFASVR